MLFHSESFDGSSGLTTLLKCWCCQDPHPSLVESQLTNMAASLVKVAGKLTVGGFALYGLSEVLSSQENTIKQISVLDSKARENIPFSLPEVSKRLRPGSDAQFWVYLGVRTCELFVSPT